MPWVLVSVQRQTVSSGLHPIVGIGDEYASDDDDLIENDDASAVLARGDPGESAAQTWAPRLMLRPSRKRAARDR